jgi:hypothetical protein
MEDDPINPVVVFRTGKVWEFEKAVAALKQARIPYMAKEETTNDLRRARPWSAVPGPLLCRTLQVPASELEKANQVLSELPFEIKTNPGAWDLSTRPGLKKGWKVFIVVIFVLILGLWLLLFFLLK